MEKRPTADKSIGLILAYKKIFFYLLAAASVGLIGVFIMPYLCPAPKVVLPPNLEQLDPAVAALIKAKAALAEAHPREAATHGDLGLAYEANLLWEEARRCFETASWLAPEEMIWPLHHAIAVRQAGDHPQALALLKNLAQKFSYVPALQQRLGQALSETGDLSAAETAFQRVIDLAPNAPQGYAGLGSILLQKQNVQRAAPLLEKAVALAPDYRNPHYLLGLAYRDLGWQDKAEIELARGLNASIVFLPDPATEKVEQYAVNLTARLKQAEVHLGANHPKDAARILEEARAHHPDNVSLLNHLAVAYMRQGLLPEADALLSRAEKIGKSKFMTYINLSALALRGNDPELALQYAGSAIAEAPKMAQAYFVQAQALARLRRFSEALKSMQTVLELDSPKPQNFAFAGDLYLEQRAYEKAWQYYESALKLEAQMLPALVGLARAQWALGHRTEAQTALAEARRLAPDHPLILRLEKEFHATR